MIRKCPACRSYNVRRASIHAREKTWRYLFVSPYRCRDCRKRFRVSSRTTYALAGVVGFAIMTGVIAWGLSEMLNDSGAKPEWAGPVMERFADTVRLAEANDSRAEYRLAQMYAQGYDVPKNEMEAWMWLERAAGHGNTDAQYELGIALLEGRGVVQDFKGAMGWLQQAAASGNAGAQYELGRMYRAGTGIPVDNAKAYLWLNLAAARGMQRAAAPRDTVLNLLSAAEIAAAQAEARRLSQTWTRQKPTMTAE